MRMKNYNQVYVGRRYHIDDQENCPYCGPREVETPDGGKRWWCCSCGTHWAVRDGYMVITEKSDRC